MAYSRENIRAVTAALAAKKEAAEAAARRRTEELHARCPELAAVDRALAGTGMEIFRIATEGGDVRGKIALAKAENEKRRAKKRELLLSLGLPEDYTAPRYDCSLCRDTGYTDRGMCACMKRLLTLEGFSSSGLGVLLEKQSFDNFSLSFYEGEAATLAAHALETARAFAEDFDKKHSNLLLVGGTGLGKTHLSTAIARIAIERGFDVVYDTAQGLLAAAEHDRFHSGYGDTEKQLDRYLECDLLILDDLGTELGNQFSESVLYHLLNSRINSGKSMIVSTNLGERNLLERYGDRITSRLFGEFFPLVLRGKDIRLARRNR